VQHDVFICHASEDKETIARPLAEVLRQHRVEVWYDEFSLRVGDSIRRAIDRGLTQSRFGIVILSKAFFDKKWPQYELDGLTEREVAAREIVILPVWHGVEHADILRYSPTLAGRRAITSPRMADIVREVLAVIRPEGSPLLIAREIVVEWGATPPVVTDSRWLEAVEASNRLEAFGPTVPSESTWSLWSFPLPHRASDPQKWGERLAWSYMQLGWTEAAELNKVTLLTPPVLVHRFIESHAGLLETAETFPELLIEYAPQVIIRGFEGPLLDVLEKSYRKACEAWRDNPKYSCNAKWALRHPTFGGHSPETIARAYFQSDDFGPPVSPYEAVEHLAWLLSRISAWLPNRIRKVLLQGLAAQRLLWFPHSSGTRDWPCRGMLDEAVSAAVESAKPFRWTEGARLDLLGCLVQACATLDLPETPEELTIQLSSFRVIQQHIAAQRGRKAKR
jgi:hypothetical protein